MLRVDVESGTQYRLGNVRFKNNQDGPLVFGEELLRQQLKLSRGDLFDVSKVRGALENLTRLYSAKGYIDMVPAPETDINEGDSRIDLTIMIDEGSPYRIGSIEVFSSERSSFSLSQLPQSKGEVFNHGLWSKFIEDGTLKSITRNTSSHTLEITLDSRPCHRATIPGSVFNSGRTRLLTGKSSTTIESSAHHPRTRSAHAAVMTDDRDIPSNWDSPSIRPTTEGSKSTTTDGPYGSGTLAV